MADCGNPAGIAGTLRRNGVGQVLWCDGTTWMSPATSTGASCTSGQIGTVNYSGGDLRFCNGSNWISMKGASAGSCSGTTPGTYTYVAGSTMYRFCDGTNWYNMQASGTFSPGTNLDFETGDFTNWTQSAGDNGNMVIDAATFYEGSYAMVAPASLNDNETACLERTFDLTTSNSDKHLQFQWKVSSEDGWDWMKFYIDGNLQDQISGTVGWIAGGGVLLKQSSHLAKWCYEKDNGASAGSDVGWVDAITFSDLVAGDNWDFEGGLSAWTQAAPTGWDFILDTTTVHGGVIAGVSQTGLADDQKACIERNVDLSTASSDQRVDFWWKVDSETYFDQFRFYIDGFEHDAVSGNLNWRQGSGAMAKGSSHLLKWCYEKDDGAASGADRGWMDDVTFSNVTIGNNFDFESGGLSQWTHSAGNTDGVNWSIDRTTSSSGAYSAGSHVAGSNDSSSNCIERVVDLTSASVDQRAQYYWKVDSEDGFDFLNFYINGSLSGLVTGNHNWAVVKRDLTKGSSYTLKWCYEKDNGAASGADRGWIDDFSYGDVTPSPGGHYLVATKSGYNGNLGGLSGANAKCLSDLVLYEWNGKYNVTLNSSTVKAFLCDGSSCQNFSPTQTYAFAAADDLVSGGGTFTTDVNSLGPNDAANWSGASYFGATGNAWTGRASTSATQWANSSGANHCLGWTDSTSGNTGDRGTFNSTGATRWLAGTATACNTTTRKLLCIVEGTIPPTFVQEAEVNWGSTSSPKTTASFDVQAGDVLVAYVGEENGNGSPSYSISGGSLSWNVEQTEIVDVNWATGKMWSAVVDSDKSMTVTFTKSGGTGGQYWGGNVLTFRGSSGIGASAKTHVSGGAPSLSIVTSGSNSAVVVFSIDWNVADGSSRTWRGNVVEQTYHLQSGRYTVYGGYDPNVGAPGSKTMGLTAPTGQKYTTLAVEVKGTTP